LKPNSHNNKIFFFSLILFLHLFLVIFNSYIFNYFPTNDSCEYLKRANEFCQFNFFSPITNYQFAPGYSLFLCLIKPVTSNNHYLIGLIQSVFFVFAINSVVQTLIRYHTIPAKGYYISVCALLLNPIIWIINGQVLSESLASSLLLFSTSYFMKAQDDLKIKSLIHVSIITGLLVITRFEYIVVPLVMTIFIAFKIGIKRYYKVPIILAFSVFLLVINGYRNEYIFGKFRLTSFGGGNVIYGGNNLNKDGSWHSESNYKIYFQKKFHNDYNEITKIKDNTYYVKLDSFYIQMAKNAWKESFKGQLYVLPVKFLKTWLFPGIFDIYTDNLEFKTGIMFEDYFTLKRWGKWGVMKHVLFIGFHWIILITGISGFILMYKQNVRYNTVFIKYTLSVIISMSILFTILFYGLPRFNVILYPHVVLFSSYTIISICFRKRSNFL
jgi:hypothetical protein